MELESTNPTEGVEAAPLPGAADSIPDQTFEPSDPPAEPEIDEVEQEFGGKKYRIPKAWEAERLMHADYTRKTQETAEERRQIQAQREAWQQEKAAEEAAFKERIELEQVRSTVKQYEAVDWNTFYAQNPEEAQRQFMQYQVLRNRAQEIEGAVNSKKQEFTAKQQQMREQLLQAANDYLRQHIPDWSPNTASVVKTTAESVYGFKPEELAQVADPRLVRLMRDAHLYRQGLEKAKAKPVETPTPQPARKVGSTAPAAKSEDQMTDAEWASWRAKQGRKRSA